MQPTSHLRLDGEIQRKDYFMRLLNFGLILVALLFVGCEYDAPLSTEHTIAIDSLVLGMWEMAPTDRPASKKVRWVILKYSETEYLIHQELLNDHPNAGQGLYYRAYPTKIGDISCVQLRIIGNHKGPIPKEGQEDLFHVISYEVKDGKLEIRTLNTDLVDPSLKTTQELREAFLKHKTNAALFKEPVILRRCGKKG